jgi:hypothetical protein
MEYLPDDINEDEVTVVEFDEIQKGDYIYYLNDKFKKQFEPYYFFTPAQVFIYKHFPLDNQHQFLVDGNIQLADFEKLPV